MARQLDSLYFNQATSIIIKNIIRKLLNKTSSGKFNISNKLVKNFSEGLIVPLCIVFNKSLIGESFQMLQNRWSNAISYV